MQITTQVRHACRFFAVTLVKLLVVGSAVVAQGLPPQKVPAVQQKLVHPDYDDVGIIRFSFLPDGKRMVGSNSTDGVIVVWNIESGDILTRIETGRRQDSHYLDLSPHGATVYACHLGGSFEQVEQGGRVRRRYSYDGWIKAWDLETGELQLTLQHDPSRGVIASRLSPSGKYLWSWEEVPGVYNDFPDKAYSLWNLPTKELMALPEGAEGIAGFLLDDSFVFHGKSAKGEPSLIVVDSDSRETRFTIPRHYPEGGTRLQSVSPDGQICFGVSDASQQPSILHCWSTETGRELLRFNTGQPAAPYHAFSPDSNRLAVTQLAMPQGFLHIFNLEKNNSYEGRVFVHIGQDDGRSHVLMIPKFSPDGRYVVLPLVVGSAFGEAEEDRRLSKIHIIDVEQRKIVKSLVAPEPYVLDVAFSPDGKTLAAAAGGTVHLWNWIEVLEGVQ